MSYRSLANCARGAGSGDGSDLEGYSGAEREVGRSGDKARARVCFIDYDRNKNRPYGSLNTCGTTIRTCTYSRFPPTLNLNESSLPCAWAAFEYLLKPILTERVLDGLARVEAKQKERMRSKVHGKVITLIGAKGGTGVTSLALHLALELTANQRKCLLVDQHAALGDASLYLGTGRHQYSFYELANNTDRLDQELLEGFLLRHSSGLHLLDSPETVDPVHQGFTFGSGTHAGISRRDLRVRGGGLSAGTQRT